MAADFRSIIQSYVNSYRSNLELKYQQMLSRLRDHVRVEMQHAERAFYDRIAPMTVVERTTVFEDTVWTAIEFDRRAITLREFVLSTPIDDQDRIRMLADPTSSYVENMMAGFGRNIDAVLCDQATATAYSGKDGNTAVTFPSTQQVAVNFVEPATTGSNSNLTIGKLRKTMDLLKSAEAVMDGEEVTLVVAQSQMTSLLRTTEVTSKDFNDVQALVDGKFSRFMGFNFVRTQQTNKTGNIRSALAFPKRGMLMAMGEGPRGNEVRVGERPDKNYVTQVYVKQFMNATRMWEEQVVEILCDETA